MAAKKIAGGWAGSLNESLEKARNDEERVDVLNLDAWLDQTLRDLLQGNFARPEDDPEVKQLFNIQCGPLSSLSNKARLAYVLGLIDTRTCGDLKEIHKIRNKFAHGLDVKFTDTEIVNLVKKWRNKEDKEKRITAENSYNTYLSLAKVPLENISKALQRDMKRIRALMNKGKKKAKK